MSVSERIMPSISPLRGQFPKSIAVPHCRSVVREGAEARGMPAFYGSRAFRPPKRSAEVGAGVADEEFPWPVNGESNSIAHGVQARCHVLRMPVAQC